LLICIKPDVHTLFRQMLSDFVPVKKLEVAIEHKPVFYNIVFAYFGWTGNKLYATTYPKDLLKQKSWSKIVTARSHKYSSGVIWLYEILLPLSYNISMTQLKFGYLPHKKSTTEKEWANKIKPSESDNHIVLKWFWHGTFQFQFVSAL
jgi:hypothetical protein